MSIRSLSTSTLTSGKRFVNMRANESAIVSATTGSPTVTNPDGETCYQFTGDGSITIDKAGYVWVLAVAGGGGGAFQIAGGGGAGGYLEFQQYWIEAGTHTVTVGSGGAGATGAAYPYRGSNSSIEKIIAVGGAPAGQYNNGLANRVVVGGSGGGGSYVSSNSSQTPTTSIPGQGKFGGNGFASGPPNECAGGGGGAGANANSGGSGPIGGNGGDGLASTITGTSTYRAGGGGGGSYAGTAGTGGLGGGGNGTNSNTTAGSGTANTGGGGGGGGYTAGVGGGNGGAGGSGIVIVRVA